MSLINESASFLSNTLKRRQQKRHEATRVLQEGISSLHLSSQSNEQQRLAEGVYPLFNIDPESYLLEEGDERSILEPNSYSNPDFKQTINILLNWMNSSLKKDSILVRSLEDDLYDGYILGKLIEFYQPNVRLLENDIPLSEESKKMILKRVLNYLEISLNQPIKWTFEQIYHRDLIAILHLLLALIHFFNKKSDFDLPKTLLLKVVVVKKSNGILQTRIVNECFIDDHDRELSCVRDKRITLHSQFLFLESLTSIR